MSADIQICIGCYCRSTDVTLEAIVGELHKQVFPATPTDGEDHEGLPPQKLLIQRRRLLQHTLAAVKDSSFSFERPVQVKFSGEDADDWGGPRREFFT